MPQSCSWRWFCGLCRWCSHRFGSTTMSIRSAIVGFDWFCDPGSLAPVQFTRPGRGRLFFNKSASAWTAIRHRLGSYPNILIATTGRANSLTITNASAGTLRPASRLLVVYERTGAYQTYIHPVFGGTVEPESNHPSPVTSCTVVRDRSSRNPRLGLLTDIPLVEL
jgi:hypothetical protein